jgi:sugar phosphate isomerase/epimerase
MKIALMSASILDRSWEDMLDAAAAEELRHIERCGGGHIPTLHFDPSELLVDRDALKRFTVTLKDREMELCSFSCHGNPLHPDNARAESDHKDLVTTCQLAGELGVPHISLLAGLPAGGPDDRTPNWIINSVFRDGRRLPMAYHSLARSGTPVRTSVRLPVAPPTVIARSPSCSRTSATFRPGSRPPTLTTPCCRPS